MKNQLILKIIILKIILEVQKELWKLTTEKAYLI